VLPVNDPPAKSKLTYFASVRARLPHRFHPAPRWCAWPFRLFVRRFGPGRTLTCGRRVDRNRGQIRLCGFRRCRGRHRCRGGSGWRGGRWRILGISRFAGGNQDAATIVEPSHRRRSPHIQRRPPPEPRSSQSTKYDRRGKDERRAHGQVYWVGPHAARSWRRCGRCAGDQAKGFKGEMTRPAAMNSKRRTLLLARCTRRMSASTRGRR
jgi:hypothetical protein